jgi:hypothetical protein
MGRLWWVGHSKHARDSDQFILFVLLSPTSSNMVFFVLLGMPNRGTTIEESREIGRQSHGAILGLLAIESH